MASRKPLKASQHIPPSCAEPTGTPLSGTISASAGSSAAVHTEQLAIQAPPQPHPPQ
ncbi:hypothetical protein [Kamptonema formosum]|uniref:hypothetical protein n=1 Tax=Kamptonema formosum TaxID=331992 RepID=UPI0012DEAEB4|nr:hypothetical protein [Oscillatoria sp. PCC 10802]